MRFIKFKLWNKFYVFIKLFILGEVKWSKQDVLLCLLKIFLKKFKMQHMLFCFVELLNKFKFLDNMIQALEINLYVNFFY